MLGVSRFWPNDTPMPTLSEAKIRASKPKERPYKVFDERGLFMLVTLTRRPALALSLSLH